ncbi:MAG TPA: hypothetical protein VFV03_05470 [Solirubrobacteraceae bacterium]|nr:hypothetical protein [Solirubrobacteraceae bacterium]
MRILIRFVPVALLGAAVALLVSCGSSGSGLIPTANAGPLQSDFEAVAQAARSGGGSCVATESALGKTEQDFLALPATVDKGLYAHLRQGISYLRKDALAMCTRPTQTATTTIPTTTTTTTTQATPTTTTQTTPTSTATTPTTSTAPSQGGGTAAPREGEGEGEESPSKDKGKGEGAAGDGASVGGASPGGGR